MLGHCVGRVGCLRIVIAVCSAKKLSCDSLRYHKLCSCTLPPAAASKHHLRPLLSPPSSLAHGPPQREQKGFDSHLHSVPFPLFHLPCRGIPRSRIGVLVSVDGHCTTRVCLTPSLFGESDGAIFVGNHCCTSSASVFIRSSALRGT
ncbi:hypothetical protein IWZ01DRAFT_6689 [Phyllosticta capitalensis]